MRDLSSCALISSARVKNRIRCANDRDLHLPCTKTKNWTSFALIRGVQDSCSFLVFQLVPAKPIASAA
jgi:hypothetical protein